MKQGSALYRIEQRLACLENLQRWTWLWAENQRPRFIMTDVLRVWRLWRVFSNMGA